VVVDILGGDGGSRHSLQSGAPSGNSSGPCMAFLRDAIGQNDAAHDQELIGPTTLPLGFIRIVVPKNARQVTSFVGAPIELGGKSIGTLYRDESAEVGESLAQNNELMARISTITGRLIDHALILNHSEMETRWINAASILTMRLLEGDTDLPLSLITDVAVGATVTDVVMLTTLHGDQVELLASSGRPSEFLKEFQLQREGSLTEHVMQSGEAVFTDNHDGPSTPSFDGASVVAAPLGSKGSIRGVLCLIRERGTVSFTHQELEFVEMFAHRASLALEVIEGRNVRMELAVLEKQKQIAQDLHAHVIREIFGTGMNLQSLARRLNRSEDAKEVQDSIAALDSVIVKIRAVIFDLGTA
jgi:signal transduction histidine kinase